MMHGVVTHVIDQQGTMRARLHGLKFKPEHLAAFVGSLLHSNHDGGLVSAESVLPERWKPTQYQLVIGLLLGLGLPLLVVGGLALKRGKARHSAVTPGSVKTGAASARRAHDEKGAY